MVLESKAYSVTSKSYDYGVPALQAARSLLKQRRGHLIMGLESDVYGVGE
jgi:hypothetical protein